METIDPNSIDQTSTIGQITMMLAVLGVIGSLVTQFLPKNKNGMGKTRMELIKERLELEKKNGSIVREINHNLSEWQIVARSLIRVLKNEVVELGGSESDRVDKLTKQLEEIDDREVDYGGDESV